MAITTCARLGRWQLAFQLLDGMYVNDIQPSVFSFGTVVDGCGCHPSLWHRAVAVLNDLPKETMDQDTKLLSCAAVPLLRTSHY